MLNIPDSADSKKLLDSAKKLQLKEKVDGDVLKELNDAEKPYGDQMKELPNKKSDEDKPSFILAVPRAPNQPEAPAKPAPDVPQDPQ